MCLGVCKSFEEAQVTAFEQVFRWLGSPHNFVALQRLAKVRAQVTAPPVATPSPRDFCPTACGCSSPCDPRTPVMTAGLTVHVWSLPEWLSFPAVQRI